MRLFGSEKISGIMEKLGIEEGEVLEHPWLNRSIETAQRRVEQQNFMMRKRTLEYDDVMNAQRSEIYGFRSDVLQADDPRDQLMNAVEQAVQAHAADTANPSPETRVDFLTWVNTTFPLGFTDDNFSGEETPDSLTQKVMEQVKQAYMVKASHESAESLKRLERHLILQAIDQHWQEYLRSMDSLRESIGLRAYGQRDPLVEYKREAYNLFMDLMERIYEEIANSLFRSATSVDAMQEFFKSLSKLEMPKQESLINAAPAPPRLNTMIPNQSDNNQGYTPNRKQRRRMKNKG